MITKRISHMQYPHYLPTWNPEQKYGPLQPFEHYEHGKDADTTYPELLPEGATTVDLTPTIGTEVCPLPRY
jgi:sulfonate dioxygenase